MSDVRKFRCPKCSTIFNEGTNFCPNCGLRVLTKPAASVSEQQATQTTYAPASQPNAQNFVPPNAQQQGYYGNGQQPTPQQQQGFVGSAMPQQQQDYSTSTAPLTYAPPQPEKAKRVTPIFQNILFSALVIILCSIVFAFCFYPAKKLHISTRDIDEFSLFADDLYEYLGIDFSEMSIAFSGVDYITIMTKTNSLTDEELEQKITQLSANVWVELVQIGAKLSTSNSQNIPEREKKQIIAVYEKFLADLIILGFQHEDTEISHHDSMIIYTAGIITLATMILSLATAIIALITLIFAIRRKEVGVVALIFSALTLVATILSVSVNGFLKEIGQEFPNSQITPSVFGIISIALAVLALVFSAAVAINVFQREHKRVKYIIVKDKPSDI